MVNSEDPSAWDDALRPTLRLDEVVSRAVSRFGDSEAVRDQTAGLTYRELDQAVSLLAETLIAQGVQRGDRVATLISAGNLGVALLYAISRAGAVSVPINELHAAPEVADALHRSRARYFLTDARLGSREDTTGALAYELLPPAERPARVIISNEGAFDWRNGCTVEQVLPDPDEIAVVLFTSGSTARPKGVLVTHQGLVGVSHYTTLALGLTEDSRLLGLLPAYHVAGITNAIVPSHLAGGTCLMARFGPERVLELLEQERITTMIAFGPMLEAVFNAPGYSRARHPNWHTVSTGLTTHALIARLREAGVNRIAFGYGLTEMSGDIAFSRPWLSEGEALDSVGVPLPGVDLQIVDPVDGEAVKPGETGEVRVKGWGLCRGYIDGSSALDERGYWRTGDLGCLRPAGTIEFKGRLKFMVKSGGENVSAFEVEHFLTTSIPEVEEAAVIGVPDERWGEKVVAFVSFSSDKSLTAEELSARCRGQIAGYKIPKEFLAMPADAWPLMAVGKLDRARLTELAVEQLGAAGLSSR